MDRFFGHLVPVALGVFFMALPLRGDTEEDSPANEAAWKVTQLTDNDGDDQSPVISGSNVVWCGSDGNDLEIFFWEGSTIKQLTDNEFDDYCPAVSSSNVVWCGSDGRDTEVFF